MRIAGARLSRASLQHDVAHLRSFLRFLATRGETPSGLDAQIDTPRVYRGERLPQALPWETVRAFLDSIDRSTPIGVRDYAIFLLIATYGLRAGEIVALTLDDIEWRAGRIRVAQRKTATPLLLPLTDAVGKAVLDYLRRGRPALPYREIFLRCRAPAGVAQAHRGHRGLSGLVAAQRAGDPLPGTTLSSPLVRRAPAPPRHHPSRRSAMFSATAAPRARASTCGSRSTTCATSALPLPRESIASTAAGGEAVMSTDQALVSALGADGRPLPGSQAGSGEALRHRATGSGVIGQLPGNRGCRPHRGELRPLVPRPGASRQRRSSQSDADRPQSLSVPPRTEPTCFVPDPSLFPHLHQPVQPYIFTEAEIDRLLQETDRLERPPESPLRPELFRLAITLLYTTGLRRGELLRMTTGDYEPRERTLLVRESKFHKSRLLPLSPDATHELEGYLQARRTAIASPCPGHPTDLEPTHRREGLYRGGICLRPSGSLRKSRSPQARRLFPAFMIFVTHLPVMHCCAGIGGERTYRRSCRFWRPTWGTCPSSPPSTTSA